eukprot:8124211-Pyramimonas_sp.AAC.1
MGCGHSLTLIMNWPLASSGGSSESTSNASVSPARPPTPGRRSSRSGHNNMASAHLSHRDFCVGLSEGECHVIEMHQGLEYAMGLDWGQHGHIPLDNCKLQETMGPPMPKGVITTPTALARPPTPWARAGISNHLNLIKAMLRESLAELQNGLRPNEP